jgi:hypothetical protein
MADAINRIVPSSVAVDRASWREKERQKRQGNETRASAQPLVESAEAGSNSSAIAPSGSEQDKGKHLDINA